MSRKRKPYVATPDTISRAPSRTFDTLDAALAWASRVARRWSVSLTVFQVGADGRSVRRWQVSN